MRSILMIVAVAGCLLAQRSTGARPATEESYDIRIARLETTLPRMQKQLDEVSSELKDVNKTLTDLQKQLAEVNTDMKLVMWIGGVVGAYLMLNTFKPIFEKASPPTASAQLYPQPVIYGSYPQPGVDVEALVKRLLAEERARNQASVQG